MAHVSLECFILKVKFTPNASTCRLEETRLEVSGVLEEDEEERSLPLQILPEEPDNLTPTLNRSLQPMVSISHDCLYGQY